DMGEYRVLQNVIGNLFPRKDVHRTVTVASRGLRHCGGSLWARDFFPIAITITISWRRPDNPRYRESRRPSKPSIGQVFIPSASAAIIRFWHANDVLFVAHLNNSCRDRGGIPSTFHRLSSQNKARLIAANIPHGPGMNRIRPI